MFLLRSVGIALAALIASCTYASAQTPAPPPPGMTQEQFNSLVDAISDSVTEKLKAEGVTTAPAAAPAAAPAPAAASKSKSSKGPPPGPKVVVTSIKDRPDEFGIFLEKASHLPAALPVLGAKIASIPSLLDRSAHGGRGASAFLLLLGAVAVAALAAEAVLRLLTHGLRTRLSSDAAPEFGLRSLAHVSALALIDGLGVLAVWIICHGAVGAWFTGPTGQDKLAAAVLTGIFSWRLYMLVFRIILQPNLKAARLCDVLDQDARGMYRRIAAVMFVIILGRILGQVLVAIGTPHEAMIAYQVVGAVAYVCAFLWLVLRSREAARQWFIGLGTLAPVIGAIGRKWVPLATAFFLALGATQIYGAIAERAHVASAMLLTLTIVVGILIFETLMQAVVRRLDSLIASHKAGRTTTTLPDIVARCIRVAVIIAAAVLIAQGWVVEVFALVSEAEWAQLTTSSRTAGFTLFFAFVLWELLKFMTDPYMGQKNKSAAQAIADGDAAASPASRISTMMPLLRRSAAVLIALVAVMIALDDFGVNITPLIAGASVFGIAISFGSQTLVKDIVSGIFYLTDDAFRVGEYIDCGKAKGTVEGFTLRSIKLRHQNGQVHTIPFGQLGQITNFSRDWITTKFNLRFARDTDIEKLRKASKKIGADMMEIPAIKADILAPFKMQGVADITDNALLVRFKFTAKPGNPAAIQREAIKRMFNTLPTLGIEFAKEGAAVVLHTTTASVNPGQVTPPASDTPADTMGTDMPKAAAS